MPRTVASPRVYIGWSGQQTGVFRLDTSLLDGTDVLGGAFGSYAYDEVTSEVKRAQITRGRSGDLGSVEQGRCVLTLKDSIGKYNPERIRYRAEVLADGPVGYWRLGETSGTTAADSSGNLNTGTYTGGVVLQQSGVLSDDADTAVLLNGSTGYISVPDGAAWDLTSFTLEAWVKTSNAGSARRRIISQQGGGAYWIMALTSNVLELGSSIDGILSTKGSALNDSAWHHVAVTVDRAATLATWYVNGASVGTATALSTGTSAIAASVYIGAQNGTSEFLGATVDEVAIYPTALSAARILTHYEAGTLYLGDYLDTHKPLKVESEHLGSTYGLFYGFVSKIEHRPSRSEQETVIEAVDFFEWLNAGKPVISATGPTTVGTVIGLILDELQWTDASMRSLETGSSIPDFEADGTASALSLIEGLLTADLGFFFIDGAGVVTYLSRDSRWKVGDPAFEWSEGVASDARPGIDKQQIINRQVVTRTGGSPQQASADDGKPFYDGQAISSDYLATDADALSLAQFVVALRKKGAPPIRRLELWNRDDDAIVDQLTAELGARVSFAEPAGGTTVTGTIEGLMHELSPTLHRASYVLSKRTISAFTLDMSALDSADVLSY